MRPILSGIGMAAWKEGERMEGGGFGVISCEGDGRVDDDADMVNVVGEDGLDVDWFRCS